MSRRPQETAPRRSRREVEKVLEERARALARPPPARQAGDGLALIVFTLDGERLALELDHVRAAGRTPPVTPAPAAPGALAGVANFRGEIVAVFDLGVMSGRPRSAQPRPYLIALGRDRVEFAILADTVEGLVRTPPAAIVRRPWGSASDTAGAGGVTADGLNVLDGAGLLEDRRFVIETAEA
jgi:purine-binding chemotaxis protein CheW